MVTHSDFRLLDELYENIALLDQDLKPIFQGNLLRKFLSENNHSLSLSDPSLAPDDILTRQIYDAAAYVKKTGTPEYVKLPHLKKEFLLVPGSDGYFYFGIKEEILHFIRIEHDLKERVKELECLYNISRESDSIRQLETFFEKCIGIIEAGFQYPGATIVNIVLSKKKYGRSDWPPEVVTDKLTSEILVNKKKEGEINVYITKGLDFLKEEKKLIDEIANKFGKIIEHREKQENLEKQKKILTNKNEALFRITEECNQKREKLKTFIRAIADRIVVIDHDFNIVMSNKDEIGEGGKCYSSMFDSDKQCEECPALNTFATASDSISRKKINDRYYTLSAHPIFATDGKIDRVLEVCRDVTDRNRMEAQMFQSYKLASIGKLVAGVAHEINNPNTFILGNLGIVQEAFDDIFPILDKQYESDNSLKIARLNYQIFRENISILVTDMVNGANRTKKIVEDLRNFAKKDVEELNDEIDLNFIIKNHLTLTEKHVKKHARLEFDLNENVPVFKGNVNKIEQVFLNLIMNASEAIENDSGIIKIKTDYDERNKEVLLYISDNGTGIDETIIKDIFDPFFTTKRDKGGIGLGLSITYGIVKDHGGRIEVRSRRGEGTTFTLRFPLQQRI